jgi:molybdate transport system regulatory protein
MGNRIALGPGKVELLEALSQTGSITAAAKRLDMSYMRAWTLIRTMNSCFHDPLVSATHGGPRGGGGALLTPSGRKVLALYRRMDAQCLRAIVPAWKKIQKLLRDEGRGARSSLSRRSEAQTDRPHRSASRRRNPPTESGRLFG